MSKGSINEIKIEMELEEWLQLKMLFLLGYNLKIFLWWCRELTFGGGMGDGGSGEWKIGGGNEQSFGWCEGDLPALKLHEKYLNSSASKEFARRRLLYTHLL